MHKKNIGDIGTRAYNMQLKSQAIALQKKAKSVGNELQSIAEEVAHKYGGRVTPINYKGVNSIIRKVQNENISIKDIKDSYRTTIIASKSDIPKIIKELSEGKFKRFTFVKHKAQNFDTGYTGNIINFKNNKTGLIGEIQVNTPKMIYAKENLSVAYKILGGETMRKVFKETKTPAGWGHALYERSRVGKSEDSKRWRAISLQQGYYKKFQ